MPPKINVIETAAASFENINSGVGSDSGDKFTKAIIEFSGLLEKETKYFSYLVLHSEHMESTKGAERVMSAAV